MVIDPLRIRAEPEENYPLLRQPRSPTPELRYPLRLVGVLAKLLIIGRRPGAQWDRYRARRNDPAVVGTPGGGSCRVPIGEGAHTRRSAPTMCAPAQSIGADCRDLATP